MNNFIHKLVNVWAEGGMVVIVRAEGGMVVGVWAEGAVVKVWNISSTLLAFLLALLATSFPSFPPSSRPSPP